MSGILMLWSTGQVSLLKLRYSFLQLPRVLAVCSSRLNLSLGIASSVESCFAQIMPLYRDPLCQIEMTLKGHPATKEVLLAQWRFTVATVM